MGTRFSIHQNKGVLKVNISFFSGDTSYWTENFFYSADWFFVIIRFLFLDASHPNLFLRIAITFTSYIITGFADAHTDLSLRCSTQ